MQIVKLVSDKSTAFTLKMKLDCFDIFNLHVFQDI